jgi:uncharacterized protein (DUF1330 family)
MMAAYVITDITITDPAGYEEYRKLAAPTIEAYGGKFVVRGGKVETLEGEWSPKRLVVVEFESFEQAKRWYGSQEYGAAKKVRQRTAITTMIMAEGVE